MSEENDTPNDDSQDAAGSESPAEPQGQQGDEPRIVQRPTDGSLLEAENGRITRGDRDLQE